LSTRQIFFIDQLTAVSAAHFHAKIAILRQSVKPEGLGTAARQIKNILDSR